MTVRPTSTTRPSATPSSSRCVGPTSDRKALLAGPAPPGGWPTIYSKHHSLISLALGAGLVALVPGSADVAGTPLPWWAVLAYAAVIGVGIDFDHFLLAWLNTGEPRALRYGLAHPRALLLDQAELFEDDAISSHERLLSHAIVVGVAVPAAWALDAFLGLVTAVVLYGHVLSDLVWEVYRERTGAVEPR